tara:strand:- start:389 stop:1348 length:960 start_codon:yes stop_codon:yes gene_type:complete
MTFFNKKTEVMQVEMTPYGRYLHSIGKFKPHSYEFVDDDIIYKISGSGEFQEAAHTRIINETPKLKINRAFQDEAPQVRAPSRISDQRVMVLKNTQRQSNLYSLGKSSFSSDNSPSFQVTMLNNSISGSRMTTADSGSVFIPQVDINFNIQATLKNVLEEPIEEASYSSEEFADGTYVSLNFENTIMHLKEFNSFYEKDNFEIEVFVSQSTGELSPLKMAKNTPRIVNGLLIDYDDMDSDFPGLGDFFEDVEPGNDFMEYYFDIRCDEDISREELCRLVDKLEINNQFLDEELICPDQRNDRFDIYATRVSPGDLEDCD